MLRAFDDLGRQGVCLAVSGSDQANRAISTSQLNALLRLHLWPIDVVVFHGPQGRPCFEGGFPLRCLQLNGKLEKLDGAMARIALDDTRTRKLMTIAGISSVVATAVIAAIGDISRFPTPDRLASYFGLTPRVRQSGDRGAIHGRISKQGNAIARTMLIEAAWSAASVPGPLRAFFLRIKDRKGLNVAAVATARKIANLIWQLLTKEAPYRWARPAFVAMKMRKLELRAGAARAHGPAGPGRDYWIKEIRHREMELVAQAEAAYAAMVKAWTDKPAKPQKG